MAIGEPDNIGLTSDYTGRLVDFSIFKRLPSGPTDPIPLEFAEPAEIVTGIEKAVQMWLVQFLTRRGTVIDDDLYGTRFMGRLMTREIRNELDVTQAFAE